MTICFQNPPYIQVETMRTLLRKHARINVPNLLYMAACIISTEMYLPTVPINFCLPSFRPSFNSQEDFTTLCPAAFVSQQIPRVSLPIVPPLPIELLNALSFQ